MNEFSPRKTALLADDFLSAVGVIQPQNETGRKIHAAMTEREAQRVDFYIADTIQQSLRINDPGEAQAKMEKNTLSLSELFSAVTIRASMEKEASAFIRTNLTDNTTADALEAAGAPSFAKLVRLARSQP